jgi:hypothetical protein
MKNNTNEPFGNEIFSDDPNKNLRIENEILRMKISAELGGISGFSSGIPPEVEHTFLQNVLSFEHQYALAKKVKLYELIGSPPYQKEHELDDAAIANALQQLEQLLEKNCIVVDFNRPRDPRFRYRFITTELFEQETDDIKVDGMFRHFLYEEFYPDHELDIIERTKEFIHGWFNRSIAANAWFLSNCFIQPDGMVFPKQQLVTKLNKLFAGYRAFENGRYHIDEIKFQPNDGGMQQAMGHAEGTIYYEAVLKNGKRKIIEGPMKIYLSCDYGWWNIFFFYLPGFNS